MESLRTSALSALTPLELRSLKLNLNLKQPIRSVLGIAELPDNNVFADLARRMASDGSSSDMNKRYLVVAIALLCNRLKCPQFDEILFEALSTGKLGGEPFISFRTLRSWLHIVMCGFDLDPLNCNAVAQPLSEHVVDYVLEEFRAPAVRIASFKMLLRKFPFVLTGQQRIWQRMLADQDSIDAAKALFVPPLFEGISRDDGAVIVASMGPIPRATLLFRTHTHGFSMRALEDSTKFWEDDAGVLFIIAGEGLRMYLRVCEADCVLLECAPKVRVEAVDVQVKYDRGICAGDISIADDLRQAVFRNRPVNIDDLVVYGLHS